MVAVVIVCVVVACLGAVGVRQRYRGKRRPEGLGSGDSSAAWSGADAADRTANHQHHHGDFTGGHHGGGFTGGGHHGG